MRRAALVICLLMVAGLLLSLCAWAEEAACEGDSPECQGVVVNTKGTCYYYDDRQLEAWVTIGSDHGLRRGARVAFVRDGEAVAEGEVVAVRAIDCVVRPDKDTPAGTILRGDDVKVIENGTRQAVEADLGKERNQRLLGAVFFGALLAYSIAL